MNENKKDVIIIGAGPVGLLLANLLGNSGLDCMIIEKKKNYDDHSKAIGISPPSLNILKNTGMISGFIDNGVKVNTVIVHGTAKKLGSISFRDIPSEYPFILSIPQIKTESILEKNLLKFDNIKIQRNAEFISLDFDGSLADITVKNEYNQLKKFSAKFICSCDGSKSIMRNLLNIPFIGLRYKDTFLMGDFYDKTGFNEAAHLFFTKYGPVESFPLPGGRRRWIINTNVFLKNPPDNYIEEIVYQRTNILLNAKDKISENPFGVGFFINKLYFYKNILFCGDSAHVMSPIGGQGMNTGFADAEFASEILKSIILKHNDKDKLFYYYRKFRKRAAITAGRRAGLSMKIGTLKGLVISGLRNMLILCAVSLFKKNIPLIFSMLTIPYNSFDKVRKKLLSFF